MPYSTWTWGQWFPVSTEDVGFKTTIMPGENPAGKEQRNSEGSIRRVFAFPLGLINTTDRAAIWNFYIARKGAYEPFYITVNGTQYLVRFRKDGLKFNWKLPIHEDTNIEVIEVSA